MCGISQEILDAIDKVIDYNFADEVKHYESEFDIKLTDEHFEDPELLEHQDHILYSLLVVQQFVNS